MQKNVNKQLHLPWFGYIDYFGRVGNETLSRAQLKREEKEEIKSGIEQLDNEDEDYD